MTERHLAQSLRREAYVSGKIYLGGAPLGGQVTVHEEM